MDFRTVVRKKACPQCGAGVDGKCWGAAGQLREANHQARVDLTTQGSTKYWRQKRSGPKRQA
jgi:NMD protein affecting ribosome stability and mRNA decay